MSQWVVKVNNTDTATNIRDHLGQFMDANDRLLANDFYDFASYDTMFKLSEAA